MDNQIIQAYRQTPWRVQLQWIGLFMLALVLVASVASIYLNVSASAAAAGREIQRLEDDSLETEQVIADLETRLAHITSAAEMETRADGMDVKPIEAGTPLYVVVPGYAGRNPINLAPIPGPEVIAQPIIHPAYTQSLWEWFFQGFIQPITIMAPVQK
jgi:hypothetical protein